MVVDVVIAGSGPAGLAAAVACAERGLSVELLGGPDAPWVPGYGVWADRAIDLGMDGFLGPVWSDAEVVFAPGTAQRLGRAYARVAKRRWRAHLLDRLASAGGRVTWLRADEVAHDPTGSTVTVEDGTARRAAIVLDATGHRPAFVRRAGEATLFQAAYGQGGLTEGHPWPDDVVTFMDLRMDHVEQGDDPSRRPTFLYAMPLGGPRLFVEETSLIAAPAVPFALLRARLARRLALHGVRWAAVDETELCLIPMDTPLPDLDQRVVGIGGAASFVHPATGYQLLRSLRASGELADHLVDALGRGVAPAEVSRTAWRVLWTDDALRRRELLLFGARLLASLSPDDHARFFRTFFAVPQPTWAGYLADDGSLTDTLRAMAAMLCVADARTRMNLLRSGTRLPAVLARVVGGAA